MQATVRLYPVRGVAFGIHTTFESLRAAAVARLKFGVLRALKPEHDPRTLGSLHFAYWVVLGRRKLRTLAMQAGAASEPRVRPQLLFFSDFSGDWEMYLAGFHAVLQQTLDLVWGSAIGWRRKASLNEYLDFIRERQVTASAYYQAYGAEATVHDVRCALRVTDRLEDFALEVATMPDAQQFGSAYRSLLRELGPVL